MLSPALPSLDNDELHKFDAPPGRGWYWYLAGIGLVLVTGFVLMRRRLLPVILLTILPLSGCGQVGDPVIKLTAAFAQTRLLVEKGDQQYIPMDLVVRNDGNRDLKFFGADGGCSCRRVDKAVFPLTLKPGGSRSLRIDVQDSKVDQPRSANFAFETNMGTIHVPASYYIMHQFQLDPDSPSHTSLQDDGDWEFEIVRRVLYKAEGCKPTTKLSVPPEFTVEEIGSRAGTVGGAPEVSYEDTTFQFRLINKDLGLHKVPIILKGESGETLAESGAVWDRLPFLTSVPEKVYMAGAPIRAFLRCPDRAIEFTKVEKAPAGVSAEVSGPRELTVALRKDAPAVIDDAIVVGTTAEGRAPLRVPVVRYSGSARQ